MEDPLAPFADLLEDDTDAVQARTLLFLLPVSRDLSSASPLLHVAALFVWFDLQAPCWVPPR